MTAVERDDVDHAGRLLSDPAEPVPSEPAIPAPPHRDRKLLILLAATALLFVIHLLPTPAPLQRAGNTIPLTAAGKTCLGIMAFAVTLWVTEALPFAATSLLIVLLIPAFGIAGFREVVRASFGDPVIVF